MFAYSPSEYLERPAPQDNPQKFYSLLRGEDLIQVHSHAFNIVLGRDLRRNVRYSCQMAFDLARDGKRVLYLNTYAGEELMRICVESAVAAGESSASHSPLNDCLRIADVPTGQLGVEALGIQMKNHDVLVINSFEYAAMTRNHRLNFTRQLIEIHRKYKATIVLFSHEMKRDLAAGFGSRGPLGSLAPFALAVSRIGEEWRMLTDAKKAGKSESHGELARPHAKNNAVSANIHEQQMLRDETGVTEPAQETARKRAFNRRRMPKKFGGSSPDPSIAIENDGGMSYHYGDFWEDPFHRGPYARYDGYTLALYARTPLLHRYLVEHADETFTLSTVPTEAELLERLSAKGNVDSRLRGKDSTAPVLVGESGSVEAAFCVVESPQKH